MSEFMANYGWFGWIIVGGLAGMVAKMIMPGRQPGGCLLTILLGIAGAVVAGFLGRQIGWYGPEDTGAGFLAAIVGSLIILAIYQLFAGRR